MDLKTYVEEIKTFLKSYIDQGIDGYVLGISGGIDSSAVAALIKDAVGADRLLGLILPCHSSEADVNDATLLAKTLGLNYQIVDLTPTYDLLVNELEVKANESGKPLDQLARTNLKVRLRMVTLYAFAQARRSLVVGTDNWDEYYTGYFTKYGDGGVDILPIVHLTKAEVRAVAKMYHLPASLVDRVPSAGLFPGQTDEGEMGITYADLDRYLLGEGVAPAVAIKIERLHNASAHKRAPLPTPPVYERD